jgi:hypothetical protein
VAYPTARVVLRGLGGSNPARLPGGDEETCHKQRALSLPNDDRTALDALLQKGADTARERAAVTLRTAKERVGLWALP